MNSNLTESPARSVREELYEEGFDFLLDCLGFASDEDLVPFEDTDGAAVNVEGYKDAFGEELPEILRSPEGMLRCWNDAVACEIEYRENRGK